MAKPARWEEWSPSFAPHVKGRYEERQFTDGLPEEQKWQVTCEKCGARHQGTCSSGAVRTHIKRFATLHLHADPLAPRR